MTRPITIEPVLNGFSCRVGCQTVVFGSKREMLTQLDQYYDHPDEVEKKFIANAVNKVLSPAAEAPSPVPGVIAAPPATAWGSTVEHHPIQ